ncbi:telomeric repeat-binding factor 1 [Heptranchias perlo]|uniref:telomeric repeat-binding factor 1 n=1 Tax=Heptranchias perlo TaxID=212740 RepID=UPI00355A8FCD
MESGCRSAARGQGASGLSLGGDFYQMVEVASGWIVDFMCYCLCQYFGAGMYEEFRVVRDAMNDVQFDKDESITPLESALLVLIEMADSEELKKDELYADLKLLLQIQGVAVCMEKGDFKKASEVLERQFQENVASESDQSLKRKLSLVINKKDPYHKFLNNFSNKRLVDSAESLANRMLSEKKSNFLVQAATKVVQSKKKGDAHLDSSGDESNYEHQHGKCSEDVSRGETDGELNNIESNTRRSKKQLYSFVEHKGWKPLTSQVVKGSAGNRKLSSVRKKRTTSSRHLMEIKKQNISVNSVVPRKRRPWLREEDMQLKDGVKRFGSGNWSKILEHYEFNNRTSVMLKDRWRTMKRLCMVDSDHDS